jgi:hypothetical protein
MFKELLDALGMAFAMGWEILVLLLRGSCDCAIDLSQRRELHGCHGLRDGVHQPGA